MSCPSLPYPQVLQDSFNALRRTTAADLKAKRMAITFKGEAGQDDGGLTREWFSLLSRAVFDPQAALFVRIEVGRLEMVPGPTIAGRYAGCHHAVLRRGREEPRHCMVRCAG